MEEHANAAPTNASATLCGLLHGHRGTGLPRRCAPRKDSREKKREEYR